MLLKMYYAWRDLMDNKSDQRTKDWFLMSSPLPTICICITYAYIVKHLGPKLMENRKPFQLRKLIIFYNFLQVLLSLKLFYDAARNGWLSGYSWRCEPLDSSPTGTAMKMAESCWLYYISKFTEFLDTIFFVLRKRSDQVSTLHVIHHGIMPFSVWWGVKFVPGGHGTFFGFLNTGVHVIMYTYYMLAAIGPQMQPFLWWKKYLTVIQMVQFIFVFIHAMQLFAFNSCNYPMVFAWMCVAHAVMFFFLFKAFYKKTYVGKKNDDINTPVVKSNGKSVDSEEITKAYNKLGEIDESYGSLKNRGFVQVLYNEKGVADINDAGNSTMQ